MAWLTKLFSKVRAHPVHRDVATEMAVCIAVQEGVALAARIREELRNVPPIDGFHLAVAVDRPLAILEGGNGAREQGSLLQAACVGAAAGLGLSEMRRCRGVGTQGDVLHFMVAQAVAIWEVGSENIGRGPSPRLNSGVHVQWAPGTLVGGKHSVAYAVLQECAQRPDSEEAARTILSVLGLPAGAELIYGGKLSSLLPLLPSACISAPPAAIAVITGQIQAIDKFWHTFLRGKEVVWQLQPANHCST